MKFHVSLFPYDRWGGIAAIGQAAQHAEELGIDAVSLPDHVIMPVRPDVPPVSTVWYDNFVLASHLATLTERIRLVFNVLVLPYRPPVQLAKLLSTLDQVSQGRITLGAGTGWLRGEFRILGVPFAERGAITDETLRAMKALWTQERPEFKGRYTSFSDLAFEPKCVQQPHIPIWIGGGGQRALERVVELGDGWSPMVGTPEDLAHDIVWIKQRVREAGRDAEALDFAYAISFGERDPERERAVSHAAGAERAGGRKLDSPDAVVEAIGRNREAGFNQLGLSFAWQRPADYLRQLDWFAAHVLPQLGVG
jgi:probable F420-dependent oxidoreductase